jgi:multiple sugar transport system ATP-binding protein
MAEIQIENLVKNYGTVTAVKGLNLTINDGEFLTLLGPSGCGKTTTLRCIAGLEQQSAGDIRIGPRVVNALRPGDRDIAMVFQFYALYPHMSAFDNMAFPLRAQQVPATEVTQRVQQAARILRIEYLLNRRPNRLGAGEQQRVALGRAMVRRPQVFLMDEPLTNLDAKLRSEMRMELKRLQRELRTTMVYVTHDQTEALSMSQRIAVMNQGVLQQVGSPLDVYNHPATLFVAGFIGSPPMNFVDCTLVDGDPALLVDASGTFRYPLTQAQRQAIAMATPAGGLIFGVRAEDVSITPDPAAGMLPATVFVREPLGDEITYDLKIGERIIRAKAPPTLRLAVGTPVGMIFDTNRTHVFDATTEQAIF